MPARVHVNAGGSAPDPALRELLAAAAHAALATRVAGPDDEAQLSITLLDDDAIAELNRRYLGHDGPTDVLAFALQGEAEPPLGDVYIGYQQALRQAGELGVEPAHELARLAVHGTLHVLGYDHPEGDDRTASPMWELQERLLRELLP
jgi:probable rRNA maturation factor